MRQIFPSIVAAIVGFLLAKATVGARRDAANAVPPTPAIPEPAFGEVSKRIREMPLGSAGRTVALMDGMTLADFRAIADDPAKFPELDQSLRRWDLGDAYIDALVERWLAVDPVGGFAAIQKLEKAIRAARPDDHWPSLNLRNALARHRPGRVLGHPPAQSRATHVSR